MLEMLIVVLLIHTSLVTTVWLERGRSKKRGREKGREIIQRAAAGHRVCLVLGAALTSNLEPRISNLEPQQTIISLAPTCLRYTRAGDTRYRFLHDLFSEIMSISFQYLIGLIGNVLVGQFRYWSAKAGNT